MSQKTQNLPYFTLKFTKMEGLGNDFIVIDHLAHTPEMQQEAHFIDPEFAKKICDRRFGVGADQILWLRRPQEASCQARMEILNADGSIAEMCGNGIRAVAIYLNRYGNSVPGLGGKSEYRIDTLAGVKIVKLRQDNQGAELVEVDMGPPALGEGFNQGGETIQIGLPAQFEQSGKYSKHNFYEVSMGNPHAVIFVDQVDTYPADAVGALIEKNSRFPKRTNVEFVEVKDPHTIQIRVWERGAGLTLACGTGACAAAVASLATGKTKNPVAVHLPGGVLNISWNGTSSSVIMEGPATEVFQGVFKSPKRPV